MRVLRAKQARKYLRFYKLIFGINENPYHVILDGNFIHIAIKFKIDLRHRLETLLQGSGIKLYVLRSIMSEMELVGSKAAHTLEFVKSFCDVIEDSHIPGSNPLEKFIHLLGNQYTSNNESVKSKAKKYIVASQDKDLRAALRSLPGIPLVYFNNVIMILEPPSYASKDFNKKLEGAKVLPQESEYSAIEKAQAALKGATSIVSSSSSTSGLSPLEVGTTPVVSDPNRNPKPAPPQRGKKKATAPNPLSRMQRSDDSSKAKKKKARKFLR